VSQLVGIGYDAHRLVEGEGLIIGGVEIAHDRALAGHSDADVLAHAVIDALLGAAGMGDIGGRFPDTDARYAGADSMGLLETVVAEVAAAGFSPVNLDCTVLMESPKLATYRAAIRERLARALALPVARVNVKATTGEGMGFVGREEGAAALAIATLRQRE
jgi:2-C-methyl-D-erythritol 2,4-cyclodiphosphate synthase